MPALDCSATDFEALLQRIGNLEVEVGRRAKDAEITAGRVDRHEKQLRNLIDGSEAMADVRRDLTMRKRALIADLAGATGLGFTWKNAWRISNIIAGTCRPPAGHDTDAALLRSLFGQPPRKETVWRHLREYRDRWYVAAFTDD